MVQSNTAFIYTIAYKTDPGLGGMLKVSINQARYPNPPLVRFDPVFVEFLLNQEGMHMQPYNEPSIQIVNSFVRVALNKLRREDVESRLYPVDSAALKRRLSHLDEKFKDFLKDVAPDEILLGTFHFPIREDDLQWSGLYAEGGTYSRPAKKYTGLDNELGSWSVGIKRREG